jgi:hypothetical protein
MSIDPNEELKLCRQKRTRSTLRRDVGRFLKRLPPVQPFQPLSEAQFYGATHVIARALGAAEPPPTRARWTHGWTFYYDVPGIEIREFQQLIHWNGESDWPHLCRNERESEIFSQLGVREPIPVGLPYFYVPDPRVERLPDTVLVMPPHSTWMSKVHLSERELLRVTQEKYPKAEVCVCLTPSCYLMGDWEKACDELGIEWIQGAHPHDAASLERMRYLMAGFEVMLTPKLGSHVIYAAASGVTVDLTNLVDYTVTRNESIGSMTSGRRAPVHAHLIEEEKLRLEEMVMANPQGLRAWAESAGGAAFRRDPEAIGKLFGWTHESLRSANSHKSLRQQMKKTWAWRFLAGCWARLRR